MFWYTISSLFPHIPFNLPIRVKIAFNKPAPFLLIHVQVIYYQSFDSFSICIFLVPIYYLLFRLAVNQVIVNSIH